MTGGPAAAGGMKDGAPRIVMTLLVRDEADILSENIEFHRAQGVDHFVITDNLSKDASPSIIAHYVKKGWATAIFEPGDDFSQAEWVTRMARLAAVDLKADWVINSDADEFWTAPAGSLKHYYATIPEDVDVVSSPRHDFVCLDALTGPWHQRMVYRKVVSLNHVGRPLPPTVAHRAHPDVLIHQGNHQVSGLGGRAILGAGLEVLHFPIRSRQQFENKISNGGAAYARNTRLPLGFARGWRELYRMYLAEGSLERYLQDHCFTPEKIAAGLASGMLVVDTRLATFGFSNVSEAPRIQAGVGDGDPLRLP